MTATNGKGAGAFPLSDAALSEWTEFTESVRRKLSRGKDEYGDSSFTCPISRIIDEIDMEVLDLFGWSWILHQRLSAIKKKVQELDGAMGAREVLREESRAA